MSDRVYELIVDIQSRVRSTSRAHPDVVSRFPHAIEMEEAAIEPVETTEPASTVGDDIDSSMEPAGPGPEDDDHRQGNDERANSGRIGKPVLGFPEAADGNRILDGITPVHGVQSTDALAFYLPFHFVKDNWGIYIRERGLLQLAAAIRSLAAQRGQALDPNLLLDFAYQVLWSHEVFHFKTEVACSRLTASCWLRAPLYDVFFRNVDAARDEEALANAYALMQVMNLQPYPDGSTARSCVRRWFRGQGPGYCDFAAFERAGHAPGKDRLVDRMALPLLSRRPAFRGRLLYREIAATHAPVYLIVDGGGVVALRRSFSVWGPLRVWAYTNDHKPPHVHTGTGPGDAQSLRFEWPSRANMDGASARIERQFNTYADRYKNEITKKVNSIVWK
ncbi:MAG: hypothetical protein JSR27_12760 [Proteobacteria bacterium]|nr:hypothetical protein [Pseudomonadota bacterium]